MPDERLFFTDDELVKELERLGLPADAWKRAKVAFEKDPLWGALCMPLFGNRYYWPRVKAFLDAKCGLTMHGPVAPDGPENLNAQADYRRRTRTSVRA